MRNTLIVITILVAATLSGCRGCAHQQAGEDRAALDTLYAPQYAQGFAIEMAGERSSILSIKNPWQGAVDVRQNLFLQRGGERPPRGFEGVVVEAPLRRVVCMSSSYVAFIDALGETDAIVGVSGLRYIFNPKLNAQEVGYDAQVNYELLAALKPDLMLVYGVSDENAQVTMKLGELGIPYIYIGEYVEPSPLGRAEWLVAFGEMFNRRGEAQTLFGQIRDRYLALREKAAEAAQRPRVLFNAPYGDVWYMPSQRSYMAQLVRDAGGEYEMGGQGDESVAVGAEKAFVMAQDADVWLNPGAAVTLADVLRDNPRFARVPAVVQGRVFNNNARMTEAGGSDFWESAVVHPDAVLRDLVNILQPEILSDSTYTYFRHLR